MAETEFARAERYWRENCRLTRERNKLRAAISESVLDLAQIETSTRGSLYDPVADDAMGLRRKFTELLAEIKMDTCPAGSRPGG